MTSRGEPLRAGLEAIRASLEAGEVESVVSLLDDFATHVQQADGAALDPDLLASFRDCEALARSLLEALHRELTGHAASARAAAAYGGGR